MQIHTGPVPKALDQPTLRKVFYQVRDNEWLLNTERIAGARFLVRDGNEVVIEQLAQHEDDAVRLFLLGSCMGALLLQRGTLPLHGNAVVSERGAVVIAGGVGAGKSTLTMALHHRGYSVLSDDICAVNGRPGQEAIVESGFPRLKLWADTCEHFGVDTETLPRIRPELEKFHYPVPDAFCAHALPLHAIYLLTPEPINRPVLESLTGMTKMKELQAQLYKFVFSEAQRIWPWLFSAMTTIATQTRICLVRRPRNGFLFDELADLIEGDLAR